MTELCTAGNRSNWLVPASRSRNWSGAKYHPGTAVKCLSRRLRVEIVEIAWMLTDNSRSSCVHFISGRVNSFYFQMFSFSSSCFSLRRTLKDSVAILFVYVDGPIVFINVISMECIPPRYSLFGSALNLSGSQLSSLYPWRWEVNSLHHPNTLKTQQVRSNLMRNVCSRLRTLYLLPETAVFCERIAGFSLKKL